jgi:hypothetical protein
MFIYIKVAVCVFSILSTVSFLTMATFLYALSLSVRTYFYKIPLLFISVTSLLYRFPKFLTADQ